MFGLRKRVLALEQKLCDHDWEFLSVYHRGYFPYFDYFKKCTKCKLKYDLERSSKFYFYKKKNEVDKLKQQAEKHGYKLVKRKEKSSGKKNTDK